MVWSTARTFPTSSRARPTGAGATWPPRPTPKNSSADDGSDIDGRAPSVHAETMLGRRLALIVALGGALVGCTTTFSGVAVQPNPLANQAETLRTSERISIVRGDMDLEAPESAAGTGTGSPVSNHHYPLFNEASFTVVSRDRLRFHVQIDHKWEEYADLQTWEVYLVDDKGRMWWPESIEHAHTHIITKMWDREQQSAVRNQYGDVVRLN